MQLSAFSLILGLPLFVLLIGVGLLLTGVIKQSFKFFVMGFYNLPASLLIMLFLGFVFDFESVLPIQKSPVLSIIWISALFGLSIVSLLALNFYYTHHFMSYSFIRFALAFSLVAMVANFLAVRGQRIALHTNPQHKFVEAEQYQTEKKKQDLVISTDKAKPALKQVQ